MPRFSLPIFGAFFSLASPNEATAVSSAGSGRECPAPRFEDGYSTPFATWWIYGATPTAAGPRPPTPHDPLLMPKSIAPLDDGLTPSPGSNARSWPSVRATSR